MKTLSAKRMWAAIAVAVVYHEAFCRPGELLSEGVDRGRVAHPIAVPLLIATTALHLLRLLNPKVDPYKWLDHIASPLKGNHDRIS